MSDEINAEVIQNVEVLRQDSLRFHSFIEDMVKRIESLKGAKRNDVIKTFKSQLFEYQATFERELEDVKAQIDKYVRDTEVGEFVKQTKSNFELDSKKSSSQQGSMESSEQNFKNALETSANNALKDFKSLYESKKIPPVNIPAIITFCSRIAELQHKISLIMEAKTRIEGYGANKELKEKVEFAKEEILMLLKLCSPKEPDIKNKYLEKIDIENQKMEFQKKIKDLTYYCQELGISLNLLVQLSEQIEKNDLDKAKNTLVMIDDELNKIISE